MTRKNILTEAIIWTVFLMVALFSAMSGNAQSVKQDANGNYIAVKAINDSTHTSAKDTGKTYTDTKGNTYPVMISKNGKLFVIRISKTGNRYNQYLKID